MKISKVVVLCAALGMGATLAASSDQVVVAPSQAPQGGMSARPVLGAKVTKGQPYSAEAVNESVQMLSDGNKIVKHTMARVYRDVEGRTRREETNDAGVTTVSISDPVAGVSWTLNSQTKIARETPSLNSTRLMVAPSAAGGGGGGRVVAGQGAVGRAGGGGGGAMTAAPSQRQLLGGGGGRGGAVTSRPGIITSRAGTSTVTEELPNKSIENLLCTGVRRTTTIEKGVIGNEQPIKIVSEEWTSMDLQVLVSTELNDPRSGRTTYKLQNVRRADPDINLFKVPSDYTIQKGGGAGGRGRAGH